MPSLFVSHSWSSHLSFQGESSIQHWSWLVKIILMIHLYSCCPLSLLASLFLDFVLYSAVIFWGMWLCSSRKYPHSPHRRDWNFQRGGGFCKAKKLKEMYEAQSEFPEGWGVLEKKSLPWGSYGYFLKLHCTQWLVCMRPKLILVPVALSNYNTLQTLAWEWTQTTRFKVQYANCFHKINSKIIEQVYNKLPASTVQQLRWRSYLSSNLTLASLLALRFKAGSLKMSLLMICLSRLTSTEYLWERNDM